MNDAFNVSGDQLLMILTENKNKDTDLVKNNSSLSVSKFCEMSLFLNIDPLDKWALHLIVILMCKNTNPMAVAKKFSDDIECPECVKNIEGSMQMYGRCSTLCSTMSDWISLFHFFELNLSRKTSEASTTTLDTRELQANKRLLSELEKNQCLQRMVHALTEAQVVGENITPMETALWAFLYMSPRTTPAGSMLERLYCSINTNARESELRCLRAMSIFNDKIDIDSAYVDTMSLVLRCFDVKENFPRLVENILRQRKEVLLPVGPKTIRPLLRTYAASAVQTKILKTSSENWSIWRSKANFPITTSTYVQKLLYFICVQIHTPNVQEYQNLFHTDLLHRVSTMKVHEIDVGCVIEVLGNLRTYNGEITNLIDFRHKCLFGINEKTRQEITLTKVLQLYISIYQHPSIIESCWRHVVPIFNHTIRMNIEEFKNQNKYQVSQVVRNLVQNILD
jgi:hypothetical protein